jgi:serine/threonine protein kinase
MKTQLRSLESEKNQARDLSCVSIHGHLCTININALHFGDELSATARKLYAACMVKSITHLHTAGFIHRFVNLTSFFITQAVVVKLTDLRFVCELNGHKRSTICGDPLYFSPEMVGQTGYNMVLIYGHLVLQFSSFLKGKIHIHLVTNILLKRTFSVQSLILIHQF